MVRLSKAYGATQALQGVSFDAPAGQITALLGHNGAGKSTLCAVLTGTQHLLFRTYRRGRVRTNQQTRQGRRPAVLRTYCRHMSIPKHATQADLQLLSPHLRAGMLAPSSGDVLLAGRSVAREAGAVQAARLGLCPQRNVLFDGLTVSEHLTLFAAIRGMPGGFCGAM